MGFDSFFFLWLPRLDPTCSATEAFIGRRILKNKLPSRAERRARFVWSFRGEGSLVPFPLCPFCHFVYDRGGRRQRMGWMEIVYYVWCIYSTRVSTPHLLLYSTPWQQTKPVNDWVFLYGPYGWHIKLSPALVIPTCVGVSGSSNSVIHRLFFFFLFFFSAEAYDLLHTYIHTYIHTCMHTYTYILHPSVWYSIIFSEAAATWRGAAWRDMMWCGGACARSINICTVIYCTYIDSRAHSMRI